MTRGKRAGDGPIAVEVEKDKSYYWCACGLSKKQPFCDGSHRETKFRPIPYKAEETKKNFFVHVSKQIVSLFVMDLIIKSNIENKNLFITLKQ
jgi:CDGSH-type Zn-finger protein